MRTQPEGKRKAVGIVNLKGNTNVVIIAQINGLLAFGNQLLQTPIPFLTMIPLGYFFLRELLTVPGHNTYFLISFLQLGTISDSQTALRNLQGQENFILTLNKKVTLHTEKKIQTKQKQKPQGFRKWKGRFSLFPGAAAVAPREVPCRSPETARARILPVLSCG